MNRTTCFVTLILYFFMLPNRSQPLSVGFEVRHFSKDTKANGGTDFKGETSIFNTDERIDFLKYYADQASAYYGDKGAHYMQIKNGALGFQGKANWKWDFSVQTWRFSLGWKVRLSENSSNAEFSLQNNATGKAITKIDIEDNRLS